MKKVKIIFVSSLTLMAISIIGIAFGLLLTITWLFITGLSFGLIAGLTLLISCLWLGDHYESIIEDFTSNDDEKRK